METLRLLETTPLHEAVLSNDIQCVLSLLEKPEARINAQDEQGRTPLHLAVEQGCAQIVIELLKCHASFSIRDCNGETAFHYALKPWLNYDERMYVLFRPYLEAGRNSPRPLLSLAEVSRRAKSLSMRAERERTPCDSDGDDVISDVGSFTDSDSGESNTNDSVSQVF